MFTNNRSSRNLVGAAKTGMLPGRQLNIADLDTSKEKQPKPSSVPHSHLVECRRSIALEGLARDPLSHNSSSHHTPTGRDISTAMRALQRRLRSAGRSDDTMTPKRFAEYLQLRLALPETTAEGHMFVYSQFNEQTRSYNLRYERLGDCDHRVTDPCWSVPFSTGLLSLK